MKKIKVYYYFTKEHEGNECVSYKSVVVVFEGPRPTKELIKQMATDIQDENKSHVYHKEVKDWKYIGCSEQNPDNLLLFGDEINITREAVVNYSKEQQKIAESMRQPLRKYLKMFVGEIGNLLLKLG